MTRDELEASFRRHMTELHIPRQFHNRIVDNFLPDVDNYATSNADQRAKPPVHYHLNEHSAVSVCGKITTGNWGPLTYIAEDVTCGACKRTSLWRYQAGEVR